MWEGLVQALLEKGKYDVMVMYTVERFGLDAPFKRGKKQKYAAIVVYSVDVLIRSGSPCENGIFAAIVVYTEGGYGRGSPLKGDTCCNGCLYCRRVLLRISL